MHIILVDPFGVEIPSQDSFGPLCNVLPLHTDSYGTFESLPHRSMVLMSTELQRVLAKCDFTKRGPPLVSYPSIMCHIAKSVGINLPCGFSHSITYCSVAKMLFFGTT